MTSNKKMPSTGDFNVKFEKLIDSRVIEMSKFLRKSNKEYIKSLKQVELLRETLSKELNAKQIEKVDEIIDTLNYVSAIEISTAYKMAINDLSNLK